MTLTPDSGVFVAAFADNHQVGDVQRGLLRQDPSLYILLRVGPGMLLDIIQTLDHCPVLIQENPEHFSGFAPVFSRQHVNHVIFLYMHSGHRILSLVQPLLEHFRRQRNDFQKVPVPQFATDRTENAGTDGFFLVIDQHGGVIVKANIGSVLAPILLARPDNDGFDHLSFFYRAVRAKLP